MVECLTVNQETVDRNHHFTPKWRVNLPGGRGSLLNCMDLRGLWVRTTALRNHGLMAELVDALELRSSVQ